MPMKTHHVDSHQRLPVARARTGRERILKFGGDVDAPEHLPKSPRVQRARAERAELQTEVRGGVVLVVLDQALGKTAPCAPHVCTERLLCGFGAEEL